MKRNDYWSKFQSGVVYHIYNRGNNGDSIFTSEKNYAFFLKKLVPLILPFFHIGAYCLLPNHFHILVIVKHYSSEIKSMIKSQSTNKSMKYMTSLISYNDFLADQFKRFFSSYALAFNRQEKRYGSIFQKKFKRVRLKTSHRILYLLAYIYHNPIHHNFRATYTNWKFSSYNAFLNPNQKSAVARKEMLQYFDQDINIALECFIDFYVSFQASFGNLRKK